MSNKASQAADPAGERRERDTRAPSNSSRAIKSVALLLARHEIRRLRRWFDEFDRDILLPILLGEIALYNIGSLESGPNGSAHRRSPGDTDVGAAETGCALRPCNAYSIAAATGLPRETVRRKIVRLVELGWIERRDNGHLFVTEAALTHFGSVLNSRELPEVIETADQARSLLAQ